MRTTFLLTTLMLTVACICPCTARERVSGPDGKVYTYKEAGGAKRELEVYFPKDHDPAKAKVPGIIFFHGGGWGGGTRDAFKYQCNYFASRGLVAATVTYRLAKGEALKDLEKGQSRKRLCVPDAKSAIRWFKANADELGIDPKRIIAGGGSAGGHISLVATHNPGLNDPADNKDVDTSVAAMVLFNPALQESDAKDPDINVIQWLNPKSPPAIAFFGDKDKWIKGWNPAYAKWKGFEGAKVVTEMAPGQAHAFFNYQPWADLTLISADRFLVELGLLKGEPTLPMPEGGKKLVPAAE